MYTGPRLLQATFDGDFHFATRSARDERYAIVFYEWSSGDTAFNDIGRPGLQTRSGYQRLLASAKLLNTLNIDKFWSHTCCVDWADAKEASTAFRHLKAWFQEAEVCVVFLGDLGDLGGSRRVDILKVWTHELGSNLGWNAGWEARKGEKYLERLERSRLKETGAYYWITSGWSLLALITAREICFYNAHERLICTTKEWCTRALMAFLIGIPDSLIRPSFQTVNDFDVLERLSWGPDLTFNPPENKAYLMMSLFDAYMDTQYGEGVADALQRLFRTVMAPNAHMSGLRLLVTATQGLLQETFPPDDAPSYAILSHTWGKDEVSFQDLILGDPRSRLGYRKILKSCELALNKGIDYLWVDTCCINKSSSSELQEAICSMYRWYRAARICFVFLEDYRASSVGSDHSSWLMHSGLKSCKWFTRGWTLQELIAPARVEFFHDGFAKNGQLERPWQYIGSKKDLLLPIANITNIAVEVLEGADPNSRSIAERMSWAAGRKTTRIEDRAYSLMGLFDCYLPMLYGEGERAFIRLQEEILKRSEDFTIFAWKEEEPGYRITVAASQRSLLASSPDAFAHWLPGPGMSSMDTNLQHYQPSDITSHNPLIFSGRGMSLAIPLARCEMGLPVPAPRKSLDRAGPYFGLIGVIRDEKAQEVELLVCILLQRHDCANPIVRIAPWTVYTFASKYKKSFRTVSIYAVPFGTPSIGWYDNAL